MRTSPTYGLIAAAAASLVIAGCYTQFESAQDEQPPDEIAYSESDTVGGEAVSTEGYDDARYRFYVNVGYPYWSPAFSVGFWDPYPFDPWLYGPPAYWYPYGSYYSPGWYYPPAAYYPPGYWYAPPPAIYADGHAGYTNRTFGATRGYGSTRGGGGAYRGSTATLGTGAATVSGLRSSTTRLGRPSWGSAVQGRKASTPSSVDRPASSRPAVRQGKTGTRSTTPQVRPAPEQRKPQKSGSRQSVAPPRGADDSAVKTRSGDSGGSRSYSPPPSSAPASRPSGSTSRPSGSTGGGSGSPRSGGRR